jgi:hypothetical protein
MSFYLKLNNVDVKAKDAKDICVDYHMRGMDCSCERMVTGGGLENFIYLTIEKWEHKKDDLDWKRSNFYMTVEQAEYVIKNLEKSIQDHKNFKKIKQE